MSHKKKRECLSVPQWWREVVVRSQQPSASDTVCIEEGRVISVRELDERSANLARGLLCTGAQKGSRIGILFPNCLDWIVSWLAVQRIGGIAVLMSTFSSPRELAYTLSHADVFMLLATQKYLNNDYAERLQTAIPELSECGDELHLSNCPYLRSIWIDAEKSWSRGTLADLEDLGAENDQCSGQLLEHIEANVSPADLSVLLYTSGSTSLPKAVLHTQFTVVDMPRFLSESGAMIPFEQTAGDRSLITNPYFWVGGFIAMIGTIENGATVVCQRDLSPAGCLRAIQSGEVNSVSGNMNFVRAMLDLPNYREGDFDALKPQNALQLGYFDPDYNHIQSASLAMTETFGPHTGVEKKTDYLKLFGNALGVPLGDMQTKIVDPESGIELEAGIKGELCVRGNWLMEGFYKRLRHEVFDADGYYHTGDECELDEANCLYFHARLGSMIKTRGANVSPLEVEAALLGIEGVVETAVLGLKDEAAGQKVVAVIAKGQAQMLEVDTIRRHLLGELSAFKVPKEFYFVDREDLPRTPSQKIKKPELISMIERGELVAAQ